MRPYVILRYSSAEAWSSDPSLTFADGPALENPSAVAAYDVRLSEIVFTDGERHGFPEIAALAPREQQALEPRSSDDSSALTKSISREVVRRVLAGESPVMTWTVRISYRNDAGEAYETCCEIRVVRLPLEIRSAVIPCAQAAVARGASGET